MRKPIYDTSTLDSTNPHARLAICLCLDTSGSMQGHPINELNAGLRLYYETLLSNTDSRRAADIAIVSFGFSGVQCLQNFCDISITPTPPSLRADGMTPMGEAVNLALDMIENRRQEYKRDGMQYYHPWLILMSDGEPNGSEAEFERAASRATDLVNRDKLFVFPIGIGREADMRKLERFSPKIPPAPLVGMNFKGFFEWLSISIQRISVSKPGEPVGFPSTKGWSGLFS